VKPISVLGWYNFDNIGDESYKLSFPRLFPGYDFIFSDKVDENAEIVILGGGDVLYPSFFDALKKAPQAKKYAFSVNFRTDKLVMDNLAIFDKIISRNRVNINQPNLFCYPDFTFILKSNKERGHRLISKLFNKYKCDLYKNVVVVVMNSFLCVRENSLARDYIAFDKVCYDLSKLMDSTSASFIFLPFGNGFPQNDRIANSAVYSYCKFWKKNLLVFDKLEIQDYLDIFGAADAAITTRLHGGIFSCIGSTPFIDLNHHTKTKLLLDWIGKPEWGVDYWHFDYHKTKTLLEDFLANKEFHKNEMGKINVASKKLLKQVNKLL